MYIHIGAGCVVRDCEIIGCFDMDGKVDSSVTKEFLKAAEKAKKTRSAGGDLPRAFVLCDNGIIFTHISSLAVCGRANGKAGETKPQD